MRFKRLLALLFALLAVFTFASCDHGKKEPPVPPVENALTVDFLQTGKSDCIVLSCGGQTAVIDAADEDDFAYIAGYLHGLGVSKIDCFIVTHYDADHVGSASKLMTEFKIGTLIRPDYEGTNSEYRRLVNAEKYAEHVVLLKDGKSTEIALGDAAIKVSSTALAAKSENDYSLVTSLGHGTVSMLFLGDAEKERFSEIEPSLAGSYSLIKLPHHGDYYKVLGERLARTKVDFAVACTDGTRAVEEKMITLLGTTGTALYVTENGRIRAVSDGEKLAVTQE